MPITPRASLVLVLTAVAAAVVFYELVKGWLTGTEPEIGEMHRVKPAETHLDA